MKDDGRWKMDEVGNHPTQLPRRAGSNPAEEDERKAEELWGFAAWNIRDGDIWFDSVYHLSCPYDSEYILPCVKRLFI